MSQNFHIEPQKKVLFIFDIIFSPKMTKIEPFILTFSIGFFLNSRFCIEKSKFEFYIKFWSRNMYNEGYIMSAQNDKILLPNVTKILKCVLGGKHLWLILGYSRAEKMRIFPPRLLYTRFVGNLWASV